MIEFDAARYKIEFDAARYKNPALQFSGGKDSLACLYLLKDQLDRVTVYWLNTGDACPETLAVVQEVRAWVPKFVEVRSDVAAWRDTHGYPSDLVPAKAHVLGVAYGLSDVKLVNRFDCCYHNLMAPMHRRMVADNVDAVIRGTKVSDTGQLPAEGRTEHYDVILPLRNWTNEMVFAFLEHVGAPRNAIYDHYKSISAPECLGCTAWWDDGKAAYLKAKHPDRLHDYRAKLSTIRAALRSHLDDLDNELLEN